ncbi:hypothetical protein D3C87_1669980 [compost metagenome]
MEKTEWNPSNATGDSKQPKKYAGVSGAVVKGQGSFVPEWKLRREKLPECRNMTWGRYVAKKEIINFRFGGFIYE